MEKMRGKELALDLLADVAGGFVQAVALHCFINNIDIAPGGASGMAILLNRLTNLPIGTQIDQYSASDRVLDLSGKGEDDQNTEDSCDHDRDSGWSGDTVFSGVFRR